MAKEPKKTKKDPRQFTKEYQGGRRKLKDVDKSGERDFGDTFIGDLLGMDKGNKLGVKGRAGLIASLKGARRESPKTTKSKLKPKSPIKKTGSGLLRSNDPDGKTAEVITTTKLPPAAKPKITKPKPADPPRRGGPPVKTDPKPAPSTAERQKQAFKKFTSKQWENMSKEQRRENDLPVSITSLGAGKYRNFKFKDGTSPLDFMNQLKRMGRGIGLDMNKGGSVAKKSGYAAGGMPMVMKGGVKVPAFAADGKGKMNKGGMAAKKKPAAKMMAGGMAAKKKPAAKKMMAGGMAKKSGYMYGGMAKKKK